MKYFCTKGYRRMMGPIVMIVTAALSAADGKPDLFHRLELIDQSLLDLRQLQKHPSQETLENEQRLVIEEDERV